MNEDVQKSCWGVTAKAVIGFAAIMLLTWILTGPEASVILAAS